MREKYEVRRRPWGSYHELHIFLGGEQLGVTQVRHMEQAEEAVFEWLELSGHDDARDVGVVFR